MRQAVENVIESVFREMVKVYEITCFNVMINIYSFKQLLNLSGSFISLLQKDFETDILNLSIIIDYFWQNVRGKMKAITMLL